MRLIFLIQTFFLYSLVYAQDRDTNWVKIGGANMNWGYTIPYKIELYTPKGIHNIEDIKQGLQTFRFALTWQAPQTSEKQVQLHFKELITEHFNSLEDMQLNAPQTKTFTEKLGSTNRFDKWYFVYRPDAGTKLIIDDITIHHFIGSDINRALRDAWFTRGPVTTSKLFKRLLNKRSH